MLFDRKGQTFMEYVIITGGILAVGGVVLAMFSAIGGVFQIMTGKIVDLGAGGGGGGW